MEIALYIFEPFGRIARCALQPQNLEPSLILIAPECGLHGGFSVQIFRQCDSALHGELRPGAYGEMRRRCGVT